VKKPLPREGLIRRGPGEQDIPDMGPDVEGHGIGDTTNRPFDQGIPGTPGSDGISGLPRTGGELTDEDDDPMGLRIVHQ
jgi:hypothetical protein